MTKTLMEAVVEFQQPVTGTEDDTYARLTYGQCERCSNTATELHTCPYSEEIHSDSTSLCNCCEHCTGECAADI